MAVWIIERTKIEWENALLVLVRYAVCRLRGRVAARGGPPASVASVESDVEAGAVPLPLPVEECALPR